MAGAPRTGEQHTVEETSRSIVEPIPERVVPTCVIADDHPMLREALHIKLEAKAGVDVVGEADSGEQTLRLIDELRPDVALVDLHMQGMDGLEVARRVAAGDLPTRVIIFTASTDPSLVRSAFAAGAFGFLSKETSPENVEAAVAMVVGGQRYVDPTLAHSLIGDDEHLSDRERDVLVMMANGRQNKEIAAQLSLSTETVKTHIGAILRKLGAASRTEAVSIAFRRSLVS